MTSLRSTRRSNATRLALAALCALALTAATRTSTAQGRRGPIVVLGLRAPNGDDEAATNMTNALRRAARDAGFDVPDSSPALEQSMAAFGCDESVPADCLAQIAGDLHATRLVYGEVRHHGRGAAAQLEIGVTLYDNTTHTSPGHDSSTVPRSTGLDNEALNPMAHRMFNTLLPAPAVVVAPDVTRVTPHPVPPPPPPPGPALPVRRYIGIGAMVVGVVGVGIGLLAFGTQWNALNGSINQAMPPVDPTSTHQASNAAVQYAPTSTGAAYLWQDYTDGMNSGSVCRSARSRSSTAMNIDHQAVQDGQIATIVGICDQSSRVLTDEFAFIIGGSVLTLLGVVLVATDHTGAPPPADAHARRPTRPTFAVLPSLSPSYQGADLVLRF